jgi:hypothetical protein
MSNTWSITDWKDLCSFRPKKDLQTIMFNRFDPFYVVERIVNGNVNADPRWGYFHAVEDATGDLNLDRYAIWVEELPNHPVTGVKFSAEDLFTYFRTHINDFVDTNTSAFYPYSPRRDSTSNADEVKWLSSSPLGAVITIEMPIFGPDESGTVVCTLIEPTRWRFSTWKTPGDNNHPVSGNREFGFYRARYRQRSGYVYQTKGADRVTATLSPAFLVFSGADQLWRSLQTKFANFVNTHGGIAEPILEPYSYRFPFSVLRPSLFAPTEVRWHIPQSEVAPF